MVDKEIVQEINPDVDDIKQVCSVIGKKVKSLPTAT